MDGYRVKQQHFYKICGFRKRLAFDNEWELIWDYAYGTNDSRELDECM